MRTIAIGAFTLLLALSGCERSAGTEPAGAPRGEPAVRPGPDWSKAITLATRWDATRSAVVCDVVIAPGFHAYSTGETVGKPLAIELDPGGDLVEAGPPQLPAGVAKDLPLGRSVIVTGSVELIAPARPRSDAHAGGTARGTIRYQVCTETACDRPRSTPFSVVAGPGS